MKKVNVMAYFGLCLGFGMGVMVEHSLNSVIPTETFNLSKTLLSSDGPRFVAFPNDQFIDEQLINEHGPDFNTLSILGQEDEGATQSHSVGCDHTMLLVTLTEIADHRVVVINTASEPSAKISKHCRPLLAMERDPMTRQGNTYYQSTDLERFESMTDYSLKAWPEQAPYSFYGDQIAASGSSYHSDNHTHQYMEQGYMEHNWPLSASNVVVAILLK